MTAAKAGLCPDTCKQAIIILSGKGGVGKSSVTAQLALTLYQQGLNVGVLDIDLCGPSIPRIFGLVGKKIVQGESGWIPVYPEWDIVNQNCAAHRFPVVSLAFLLDNQDDPVIWRGPKKYAIIKQFVQNVEWASMNEQGIVVPLDVLLVDTPPGTSDEHLAILEHLRIVNIPIIRALLVTTPQIVSLNDVEREIVFCKQVGLDIFGLIENMAGYECIHCKHCNLIFSRGGGVQLANKYKIDLLASLPIIPPLAYFMEMDSLHAIQDNSSLENYSFIEPPRLDSLPYIYSTQFKQLYDKFIRISECLVIKNL